MTDQTWELLTRIAAIAVPLLGFIVAWQGQRLTAWANQRDSDRKDHEALQARVEFWRTDNEKLLTKVEASEKSYNELNVSYVALATKHDEVRTSFNDSESRNRTLNDTVVRQGEKISRLEGDNSKQAQSLRTAGETIATLTEGRNADHRQFEDNIIRANDLHTREQERLQSQVNELTETLRRANDDIVKLQRRVADVEAANMTLAEQNRKQGEQIEKLVADKAALIAERAGLLAQLAILQKPPAAVSTIAETPPLAIVQQ